MFVISGLWQQDCQCVVVDHQKLLESQPGRNPKKLLI